MDVFYALAEPRRRKIMETLASSGSMTATEIYKHFDISPQAVSQHLKVLLDSRLLKMHKNAQQHIYEINSESLNEIEQWTQRTAKLWNQRFDALDKMLATEKKKMLKNKKR